MASCFLIFAVFGGMAAWAVANGTFYDDEIYSIRNVTTRGVAALIRAMNAQDVSPPGSYVINRILLDLFSNSWALVKVADGFCNALGLAFFFWMAWPKLTPRGRYFLGFLLATAATLILWGTSLRWYAYYNPLFMVATAVLLFSDFSRNIRSVLLCVFAVILFHVSYISFCSVPVLLALHIAREWRGFRSRPRDVWLLLGACALALAICIPQLIIFTTVHNTDNSHQRGAPLYALTQILFTLGLGHAVFPLAPVSLFTAAVLISAGLYALLRHHLSREERILLLALTAGILLMTVTGLGAKPRNSTYLLPLVWFLMASLLVKLPRQAQWCVAAVIGIFHLLGMYDVVAHQHTAKGSYNTDYRAAMGTLHQWQSQCPAGLTVFHHDAVLGELMWDKGLAQSSPLFTARSAQINVPTNGCFVVVKTYHEPFDKKTVEALYQSVQDHGRHIATADISPDADYQAKSWIAGERFSPYYVHLELYRAEAATILPAWYRQSWAYFLQ